MVSLQNLHVNLLRTGGMSKSRIRKTSRRRRSDRLLDALRPSERIVVLMHDNPDPDAIASAWAVSRLVLRQLGKRAKIVGGGNIVRAENRHMLRLLKPPIELVSEVKCGPGTAIIFVDCGAEAANHLDINGSSEVVAVIDHHSTSRQNLRLPFVDIRPAMASTAAICAGYLREQNIEPDERLATALLYATRAETRGEEFAHSRQDRAIISWLSDFANPEWLAEIECAPLPRAYFGDLVLALQNTFLYDDAAFCLLPRAEGPEIVGEVADLLIRCDGVRRVFCGAAINDGIVVSVRTTRDAEHAGRLIQRVLAGLGRSGGHAQRAGGHIAGVTAERITESMEDDLRDRWLEACRIDRERGTRLIPLHELVDNLF